MKNVLKLVNVILAVIVFSIVFVACDKNDGTDPVTTEQSVKTETTEITKTPEVDKSSEVKKTEEVKTSETDKKEEKK